MENDLSKLKVGDKVWIFQSGWCEVEEIDESCGRYPIYVGGIWYTYEGNIDCRDKHPSLFAYNPFEQANNERVVLVSDDGVSWDKRVFIKKTDFLRPFLCWANAQSIDEAKQSRETITWKYMKELPKLTKKELIEKTGLTIEEIKGIIE